MGHAVGDRSRRIFARSIIHPTDCSPSSDLAFAHALAIALFSRSRLDLLQVDSTSKDGRGRFPSVRKMLCAWGLLESGSDRSAVFEEFAVGIGKIRKKGSFLRNSLDRIREVGSDLVVLGSESGKGMARWLKPPKAVALARRSGVMTLVVPQGCRGFVSAESGYLSLERILLPIGQVTDATASLVCATSLAEVMGDQAVQIEVFHVGKRPLPSLKRVEGDGWIWLETRREGGVVKEILRAARNADLIVLPMNDRKGFSRLFRRNVTKRVLRKADCPILLVPDF